MLDFRPNIVWKYFEEITKIPRCSGQEGEIRKWIIDLANAHNFKPEADQYGNVKISKKALKGFENSEGLILQAHLDMVCEPAGSIKFPLNLIIERGWIKAQGTTLGADDGIGVSMALSVLISDHIKHPPLEILFTVEEETGLTGASNLKPGFITYKRLINIDSEDEGKITIGGAGGGNSAISLPLKWDKSFQGRIPMVANITGLKGGHSGVNIHERANAIKLLSKFLKEVKCKTPEFQLISLEGGTRHNVIPSEAKACFLIKKENEIAIKRIADEYLDKWEKQWGISEPGIKILLYKTELPGVALSKDTTDTIVNLLDELPSGVIAWSKDFENVVQTSTNLATIKTMENTLDITQSSRSLNAEEIDSTRNNIKYIAEKNGADCFNDESYPAWKPDPESALLKTAKNVYKNMYGIPSVVEVIHGGLETGVILNKFPEMDMISIGPTMENVHSTGERLNIETVEKTYNFLLKLLDAAC
jgi:dipeptidase D